MHQYAFLPIFVDGKSSSKMLVHLALNFALRCLRATEEGSTARLCVCVCVSVDIFTQQLSVPDGEVASVPI